MVAKLANAKAAQYKTTSAVVKTPSTNQQGFKGSKVPEAIRTCVVKNAHLLNFTRDVFASCLEIGAEIDCLPRDASFVVVRVAILNRSHLGHRKIFPEAGLNRVRACSVFTTRWSII